MNWTLVSLALLGLVWPAVALAGNTKRLPWPLKLSPVIIAFISAISLWQHAATTIPVVSEGSASILSVSPGRILADVTMSEVRPCRLQALEVFFVDSEGFIHEGKLSIQKRPNPDVAHSIGTTVFKKSMIVSVDGYGADYFYFRARHLCAFNIAIDSTFGRTEVPKEFNYLPAL